MRPIIRSATHNKVRRDPILGRDPWFENPGSSPTVLLSDQAFRRSFFKGIVQVTFTLSKFRNCYFFRSFFPGTVTFHGPFPVPLHSPDSKPALQRKQPRSCIF